MKLDFVNKTQNVTALKEQISFNTKMVSKSILLNISTNNVINDAKLL